MKCEYCKGIGYLDYFQEPCKYCRTSGELRASSPPKQKQETQPLQTTDLKHIDIWDCP